LRGKLATYDSELQSLLVLRFVGGGQTTDAKSRRRLLCFGWSVQSLARLVLGVGETA
jgi:hypothetical protein